MSKLTNPIKRLYDSQLLPYLIDKTCQLESVAEQRLLIVPKASGVVLEIGIGTGLNAKFYDKNNVHQVIGVDPNLHPKAEQRFAEAGIPLMSKPLSAETLPLADESIDSIVMTFTLCSIADPISALAEMKRVLKPAGKLYYMEHGLAPEPKTIVMLQKSITPIWKPFSGGCHLDRDIEALIKQAGFEVNANQGFKDSPNIVSYYYWGIGGKPVINPPEVGLP